MKQALEVLRDALGGGGLETGKVGSGRKKPAIDAPSHRGVGWVVASPWLSVALVPKERFDDLRPCKSRSPQLKARNS